MRRTEIKISKRDREKEGHYMKHTEDFQDTRRTIKEFGHFDFHERQLLLCHRCFG